MILIVVQFLHTLCVWIAVCAGALAMKTMLAGRIRERSMILFFRCSLGASILDLVYMSDSRYVTYWASMVLVYIVGIAIVGWRKFKLHGLWRYAFVLCVAIAGWLTFMFMAVDTRAILIAFVPSCRHLVDSLYEVTRVGMFAIFAAYAAIVIRRLIHEPCLVR